MMLQATSQPADMTRMDLRIEINSVDVTRYVDLNEVQPSIISALDEELDTLTLTLIDADDVAPVEWQEIVIYNGWAKIFGGYIITSEQGPGNNKTNNNYVLGCSDYAILFDRIYVKKEFVASTDIAIIAGAFAESDEISSRDEAYDSIAGSVALGTTFIHPANCQIEFTLTALGPSGGLGVAFRMQDASNFWYVYVNSLGRFELGERFGGVNTSRGLSTEILALAGCVMKIVADRQSIRVYVDEVLAIVYSHAENFISETDGYIDSLSAGFTLSDLSTWAYPVFDITTYANTLQTFPRARFNRRTIREILDWLCTQTGGHWYVDYDKALHYGSSEMVDAPYDVTNDPTDLANRTIEDVRITRNGAGVVNLVDVVGGTKLSDDLYEYYTPAGYTKSVDLSHRYQAPSTLTKIQVKRNDGGPTTNLILNPSFEVNITDDWAQYQSGTGATWVWEANAGAFGARVLRINAGTAVAQVYRTSNIAVAPGEWLTVAVQAWCSLVGKARLQMRNVGAGYTAVATTQNALAMTWERISCSFQNTTNATINIRVDMFNLNADSATPVFFDGVQAEKKGWASAYCDGSLGTGYAWTGTAHNSASTRIDMPIWTTLTVLTGGIDTLTKSTDVLYYESTARLEQLGNWPGIANGVEIFGRHVVPMRARLRNQASYDHYGKWLQLVVNAPEIIDKAVGVMRGKAELAQNAFANIALRYITREPGLRAGQVQNVFLPARKISADYLIQRVTTTIGIGGYITAVVELGAVDQSLVGLLLALKRASTQEQTWNENESEVLDEVIDIAESISLTEGTPTVTASQGPYNWGSFNWDYGVWG